MSEIIGEVVTNEFSGNQRTIDECRHWVDYTKLSDIADPISFYLPGIPLLVGCKKSELVYSLKTRVSDNERASLEFRESTNSTKPIYILLPEEHAKILYNFLDIERKNRIARRTNQ